MARCSALLLALCLVAVGSRAQVESLRGNADISDEARPLATTTPTQSDGRVQLQLCECEPASGPPHGLSCDKEGWFITGFERQGQWVIGGGYVPLGRAICCRPCLPGSLPDDPSGRVPPGDAALAVVSLSCHASADPLPTRCEAGTAGLVTGYAEDVAVFAQQETYYPINAARCCTPSLLLASGAAWGLERCDCRDSAAGSPVGCGGQDTHELLMGYSAYRLTPAGNRVPVGPAQCCRLCLTDTVHPLDDCAALSRCSGHGVCALGECQCFGRWAGPDCSGAAGGRRGIPSWAVALIVLSSCALATTLMVIAGFVVSCVNQMSEVESDEEDEAAQPLLLRIDANDAGSVGSCDTTDDEETSQCDAAMVEGVERRIEAVLQQLEGSGEPDGAAAAVLDAAGPGQHAPAAEPAGQGAEQPSAVPADAEAPPDKAPMRAAHAQGPLGTVDCSVCMIRGVQVVLVPCGHVCMCRRCSRRLKRCPVCRKDIARRQRLFL